MFILQIWCEWHCVRADQRTHGWVILLHVIHPQCDFCIYILLRGYGPALSCLYIDLKMEPVLYIHTVCRTTPPIIQYGLGKGGVGCYNNLIYLQIHLTIPLWVGSVLYRNCATGLIFPRYHTICVHRSLYRVI